MKKYALMILAAMASLSCSSFKTSYDYDQNSDFGTYKTFSLATDKLEMNDLDQSRVTSEIAKQLNAKGLVLSTTPDVVIHLAANHKVVQNVTTVQPYSRFGWGSPWGGWGSWGLGTSFSTSSTNEYNEGALVLDFVDTKTNKLVWQGKGSGIHVDNPKSKQKEIPELIFRILKNYPPEKK